MKKKVNEHHLKWPVLQSIFIIMSFLLLVGSVSSQTRDTMINVGSYNLHFVITQGKGVPVLFESGAGNDATVWEPIIGPLYHSLGATLIRYDREGFGKSSMDTTSLTIMNEIKGLETGLARLGFKDAFFFVSHSLGGAYTMVFNQRNKGKFIGGVLIDAVTPCFMTEKKAKEAKAFFQDSIELIKKESLAFYYTINNYEATSKAMREASRFMTMPLTVICSDSTPFEDYERSV